MEKDWIMRSYREGDEKAISVLKMAVNPETNMKSWFNEWEFWYKKNPFSKGPVWIHILENDQQFLGYLTFIPMLVKIKDSVKYGGLFCGVMTHPDFRRQGIFETLTREITTKAESEGIDFVFGFPNFRTYPGYIKKLNWFAVAPMTGFSKILRPHNFFKSKIKRSNPLLISSVSAGFYVVNKTFLNSKPVQTKENLVILPINIFNDDFDRLWEDISNQFPIMFVRNKDYLNWRFTEHPGEKYFIFAAYIENRVQGYLVIKCKSYEPIKEYAIGEIFASSPDIASSLISYTIDYCSQNKADIISHSTAGNNTYLKAFKENGFIRRPNKKGTRFSAYTSDSGQFKTFLQNSKNWHVQDGYSDTF